MGILIRTLIRVGNSNNDEILIHNYNFFEYT